MDVKYRFLKIAGDILYGKHAISKDDLLQVKQGSYETIIDLENMTQFDAEANQWKEIAGDEN